MTLRPLLALLLLPAAAIFAAQNNALEFNGVIVTTTGTVSKVQVSLLDLNTGNAKWVSVGGKFEGYLVKTYTPAETEIGRPSIVLVRETTGQALKPILLKDSTIQTVTEPPQNQPGQPPRPVQPGPGGVTVITGGAPGTGTASVTIAPAPPPPNAPPTTAPAPAPAP